MASNDASGRVTVLLHPPFDPLPGLVQKLEERYTVLQWDEFNADSRHKVSALVCSRKVDARVLDSMPHLRIIFNTGIGVDNVDIDLCRQRGIRVCNAVVDSVVADTADLAILLMLAVLRRITSAWRFVQDGLWCRGPFPLAKKASGIKVGIVGFGRIGFAVAKRATALNNIVSYYGPNKKQNVPYTYYSNLVDLATDSDVLIITCPLSNDTEHLIGKDVLNALGPSGILINVARGSIVNELELIKALKEKRLGAAGLDVFESEPHIAPDLIHLDNVVLSPHVGASTWESRVAVGQLALDNFDAFFSGKPLLTPVV
ncbi:hypothetical protein KP509_31G006000 [Ceratopteris richardii]|uniref:Uncharacterized protein n=1 Tax=Ceratopteris richardii TaxID=49495 RepID=A0A8T2QWJ2_CERRI|nr:hypothetical protein KP509_31G006000 [Ceratopteris richardii]